MISDLTFLCHFHQKKSKHETDFGQKDWKSREKKPNYFKSTYNLSSENFTINNFTHSFYESDNSLPKPTLLNTMLLMLAIFVMNFNLQKYGN